MAALTRRSPAREYVVGGVNAPQQAIYDFLARSARPAASPPSALLGGGRCRGGRAEACRPRPSSAPLLTRGVVEIFRHDWSLDSNLAREDWA